MVGSLTSSTLAHSPRVRNYGFSETIWFPRLLWAVGSVGECTRVFFFFFLYNNNNNNNNTIYTYTYILHLLGFERAMGQPRARARYTLQRCKCKSRLGQLAVTFHRGHRPQLESVHRLSVGNQPKPRHGTPFGRGAIFFRTSRPTTWSEVWCDAAKPLERRRNNVTPTWSPTVESRLHAWPSADVRCRTGIRLAASRAGIRRAASHRRAVERRTADRATAMAASRRRRGIE